jgi:phosphonatase-like hydrolase
VNGAPPVSLVCTDLIGTMVADDGMIERAYAEACATQGIVPGTAAYARSMVRIHQARGQPPVEVFRTLFPEAPGRAEAAALSFERSFRTAVERSGLAPAAGAEDAIGAIRDSGTRICVITCLSRRLLGIAMDTVGWWRRVDLALCPEDAPRGCPWPDLVLTAMLRVGVNDVREAAFAGTTGSAVLSGQRAGSGIVAGVLTGAHTKERLQGAGATDIIDTVAELPDLLGRDRTDQPLTAPPSEASAPGPRVPLDR